jgi:glycosyltransferase involved in cell wall biosynthesis
MMPRVSVIIAAYRSQAYLGAALDSVLAQDFTDFEIVIAPDDPGDYAGFAGRDPRIRVLPGVAAATGPGPARNRALAAARGDWVALLDDDDAWSPGYLSALVPAAEAAGAAFGITVLELEGGGELRRIPPGATTPTSASFGIFARAFASFHGLARRMPGRAWQPVLAEDVLFDLETLSLAGGTAPLCPAASYHLRIRTGSATRSDDFVARIGAQYARLVAMVEAGEALIRPEHRPEAVAVFESWAEMNRRFSAAAAAEPHLAYQIYIKRIAG